jgi:prepilin peptidase CpaA
MSLIEVGRWSVAAVLIAPLVWAAVTDIRIRKIPNQCVLAVLVLFLPWAMLSDLPWVLWALAGGAIALAVSFGLYAVGMIGAGDSKLFAALALFVGLGHLTVFAIGTALAGGAIALASVLSRPQRALVMVTMRGKGDFGRGIPYGVAIALSAAVVVWASLLKLPLPMGGLP